MPHTDEEKQDLLQYLEIATVSDTSSDYHLSVDDVVYLRQLIAKDINYD